MGYSSVETRWRRIVGACGGLVVANGVVIGALVLAGREAVDPALGAVALGAVIAAPGGLALMGLADRPHLWLAAAVAALPLAFLTFAGFALAPVSVALVLAWARIGVLDGARPLVPPAALVPLLVVLQLAAAAALFLREDPVSWTTADGGGATNETSDVITTGEAGLSLGTIAALLVAGWVLSSLRHPGEPAAVT